MGDFLGRIAEEILELFKNNYKRPKLWIIIIGLCFVFVLLIPYIDANFFYYSRMEKRIAILEQAIKLDNNIIKENYIFTQEYQSILDEIKQNQERSINSVMNKMINLFTGISQGSRTTGNRLIKFLTGASWLIILALCVPFMNTFKRRIDQIIAFFIVLILAIMLGFISMNIPTIITPMINYISIPLLQLVVIIGWGINSSKNKKKNTD